MKLFGSSGIRGLVNEKITNELCLEIGMAIGSLHSSVIVGRDPRTTSEMLLNALNSGLLSAGADVHNAGLVTTPTLAFATRNFSCGVMITASHNTAEYNGVKFWNPDGMAFDTAQMIELENIVLNRDFRIRAWNEIGNYFEHHSAIEEHKERMLSLLKSSNLKVVVDCGSGSAGTITPLLLREMGCDVITLNGNPDGYFPARKPEPTEENLSMLKRIVKDSDADLGIAHDGDADRMTAVDDEGNFIGGDKLLAIFTVREVRRSIVVPVNTSMLIDELVKGKVIRTKVGDVYVSEGIKKSSADFGGEPSGTWIFPAMSYCPDGVFAAGKLVEIASEERISELAGSIPEYPMLRGKIPCDENKKDEVMKRLRMELEGMEFKSMSTLDGIRVDFEDSWFLIRASGTEPILRLSVEARSKEKAKRLYEFVEDKVERCLN